MRCGYHIPLSCLLLLLELATQCWAAACFSGQYSDSKFALECDNCPPGQTQSGTDACLYAECCLLCGRSTYQYYIEELNWNMGCKRCPTRHQSDLIPTDSNRDGQEDCEPCPYLHSYMMQNPHIDDTIDDDVSYQCKKCPENSTQDGSIYDPTPVWHGNSFAGSHADNSMSCLCNAGFLFEEGVSFDAHTCVECPMGTYKDTISNEETETCQACPPLSNSPAHSTTESACTCNVGYSQGINGCEPIVLQQTCVECSTGKFSSQEASTCQDCGAGKYQENTGQMDCDLCPSGQFQESIGTSTCEQCQSGSFQPATGISNATNCIPCDPGTYSLGGVDYCTPCASGKFNDAEGATSISDCEMCPENTNTQNLAGSDEKADCVCNTGYTGTGASCEACRTHSNSSGGQTDCTCNKGYGYVSAGGVGESCVQCVAGTYKDTQENQGCSDCNENEFSSGLGADTNTCRPCPANSKSPQQSTSPSDCVCNQGYSKGTNNDETCTECVPGKYKTADSSECVQCDSGTFSGASAATSAETCNTCQVAGGDICQSCECRSDRDTLPVDYIDTCDASQRKYFDAELRSCQSCPVYQYIFNVSWKRSCEVRNLTHELLHHSRWHEGRSKYECMVGFEDVAVPQNNRFTQCHPCAIGTYKTLQGQHTCQLCPANTTTTQTGAVNVQQCMYCPQNKRLHFQQDASSRYFVLSRRVPSRALILSALILRALDPLALFPGGCIHAGPTGPRAVGHLVF